MDLHQIGRAATPENSAFLLNPSDNVAVARVPLAAGLVLRLGGRQVRVLEVVPAGHKVAVVAIEAGASVLRYGQRIGRASAAILAGQHVHTHNVAYEEAPAEYEFPARELPLPVPPRDAPTFLGYPRRDGRVGTRNYIAVAAASNCAAHTAELAAASFAADQLPANVDGVVAFPHGEGCGMVDGGPDLDQLQRTIAGVLDHPNVSGALIIGLGCEVNQIDPYLGAGVEGLTLQASGGTRATVEAARALIRRLIERAAGERRIATPAAGIVLGLNCGGSDSFSGVTANPALGVASDLLVRLGATAVLAETPEVFGAEHLLVARARSREVAERFLSFVHGYREYLGRFLSTFNDNPSPGNKAGGLTTILEKSLGAVAKAGSSPMMDAVDYAGRIRSPGFVFMNTPGYDPPSLAGLAAGGVNLIAFTTGRGSAIGFPTVPVIKIASNSHTFRRMRDNMDVNAGRIADAAASVEQIGSEILDLVLRVASGQRTSAEILGHKEFAPWRIGPVM